MRTIEEIKKEMTDAVLNDSNLRTAFGLNQNEEWDRQVSSVSILNLIIYIVAMAARTIEWLHERFRAEVEERIAAAFPGSVSWYWNKVMQFRYGYELDENAAYEQEALDDDDALIITHCAVFEIDNGIVVKVNKGTSFEALSPTELDALREYVDLIKFAGTSAYVYSYPPDQIELTLNIWRDPMVLNEDMEPISGNTESVSDAVTRYLDGIAYGGMFNKTKLIDAVQAVPGVRDVTISEGTIHCQDDHSSHDFSSFVQNFRSHGGHFIIQDLQFEDITNPNL
jgi:hypothetical protein